MAQPLKLRMEGLAGRRVGDRRPRADDRAEFLEGNRADFAFEHNLLAGGRVTSGGAWRLSLGRSASRKGSLPMASKNSRKTLHTKRQTTKVENPANTDPTWPFRDAELSLLICPGPLLWLARNTCSSLHASPLSGPEGITTHQYAI